MWVEVWVEVWGELWGEVWGAVLCEKWGEKWKLDGLGGYIGCDAEKNGVRGEEIWDDKYRTRNMGGKGFRNAMDRAKPAVKRRVREQGEHAESCEEELRATVARRDGEECTRDSEARDLPKE